MLLLLFVVAGRDGRLFDRGAPFKLKGLAFNLNGAGGDGCGDSRGCF